MYTGHYNILRMYVCMYHMHDVRNLTRVRVFGRFRQM